VTTLLTADTITDEQIRELRRIGPWSALWYREFSIALGDLVTVNNPPQDRTRARARCAEIINARAKGTP